MTTSTTGTSIPFVPGWTSQPIPNFSLSASGLIVLADLSTIAQRTALRGGSSWLDSLLLAPGLHYQQAADDLTRGAKAQVLIAVEVGRDGKPTAHRIANQAVVSYVLRVAKEGRTVVLDVGGIPLKKSSWGVRRKSRVRGGQRAMLYGGPEEIREHLSWLAQLLYVASPVLTCVAIAFVVLLKDWWALAIIGLLMVSRILNITVIKARCRPKPTHLPSPFTLPASLPPPPRITQYTITLSPTTTVTLRGLSSDLYAITTTVWLRPKSHLEGYLEAIAKVLVYLVAAISGNATQAGNIVLLLLLLVSAGLLALSNAQQRGLRNGGRVVEPSSENGGYGQTWPLPAEHGAVAGGLDPRNERETTESWAGASDLSSMATTDDALEKGHLAAVTRRRFPSDDSVEYEVRMETRAATIEISALRH
ncbi:unnamed protein product [Discula destructiva]